MACQLPGHPDAAAGTTTTTPTARRLRRKTSAEVVAVVKQELDAAAVEPAGPGSTAPKREPEGGTATNGVAQVAQQSCGTAHTVKVCLRGPQAPRPRFIIWPILLRKLHAELTATCASFWFRRETRRRLLRQIAQECARVGPLLRRKAAELRASAVKERLQLLRAGDLAAYQALASQAKEGRLREILEDTERILRDLKAPTVQSAADVQQPRMMEAACGQAKLLPHQLDGLRWLASLVDNQMSGILADDMGLGKTVQTLALFAHLKEQKAVHGPHVVVVPLGTLAHWVDEIKTWTKFRFLVFRGNKREGEALLEKLGQMKEDDIHIVLTTYEQVVNHVHFFTHYPWHFVVVDEGQRIKNSRTRLSKVCHQLPCKHRLLLSGTPIQNSLRELWSLLAFVAPHSFGSLDDFEQWFALPPPPSVQLQEGAAAPASGKRRKGRGDKAAVAAGDPEVDGETARLLTEEEELLIIQRLHRVLRPFLLRRTKEMVLKDLPEKREVVIWVPLSGLQKELYRIQLRNIGQADYTATGLLMNLRKALNHPYHFIARGTPVNGSEDQLMSSSGKFEFLDRVIPRLFAFGHKMLIFAQMTSLLDLLQELLVRRGIRCARIDGQMPVARRKQAADLFRHDPELAVLLISTRAGGLGLNLQAADTVVLFDSDWNPQVDNQAMDRAYRIGQQKPVLVIRLATPTSLDRGLFERAGEKLQMERKVISAGRFHGGNSRDPENLDGSGEAAGLLRQLIGHGRRWKGSEGKEATPLEEISKMLARSPEELAAFEAADLALLGPAKIGAGGAPESAAQRLHRCGRLASAKDAAGHTVQMLPLPPAKRRCSRAAGAPSAARGARGRGVK